MSTGSCHPKTGNRFGKRNQYQTIREERENNFECFFFCSALTTVKNRSMYVNRCVVRTAYRKHTMRMVANAVNARIHAMIMYAPRIRNVPLMSSRIQHLDRHLLPFVARVCDRFRFDHRIHRIILIISDFEFSRS